MGIIGTLTNGFVLTILTCFAKNRRQTTNVLIINQTTMDLLGSISLIITYLPTTLSRFYSNDSSGYTVCLLFHGAIFLYTALFCSINGLAIIAFERYIKIVHYLKHRKYYRPWMIYPLVAQPWVYTSICVTSIYLSNTVIVDGHCCLFLYYPNLASRFSIFFLVLLSTYLVPVCAIVLCYFRIAKFIHGRSVTVGVQTNSLFNQKTESNMKQLSVIKTLVIISAVFAFTYLPSQTIQVLASFRYPVDYYSEMWSLVMLIHLLNLILNSIMYAWQYESVRNSIVRLLTKQQVAPSTIQ